MDRQVSAMIIATRGALVVGLAPLLDTLRAAHHHRIHHSARILNGKCASLAKAFAANSPSDVKGQQNKVLIG